MEELVKGKECP